MNNEEIKTALKDGKIVYWKCSTYYVSYRAHTDELFVVCRANNHMIGVGRYHVASDFYMEGAKS